MENQFLKNFAKYHVLTASEVAEMLQISRQTLSLYVKEGKISFLKNTSNGTLFYRPEIEEFIDSNRIINNSRLSEYGGSTAKSIQFFNENKDYLDDIVNIYIYFNDYDAILDGFFEVDEEIKYGELKRVKNPTFVLRDKNGKELWLNGCNCGYGGEGPGGSVTILKKLGFEEKIIEDVRYYKVIKLFKDNQEWDYIHRDTKMNEVKSEDGKRLLYNEPSASIYYYMGRLVLLDSSTIKWDINPLLLLEKYQTFIPDPKEITIFDSDKQAIEYGYHYPDFGRFKENVFRMIITDKSGRQLWLNPNIDRDIIIEKQSNIRDIAKYLGFNIKEKTLPNYFKSWFDSEVRKIPPQPLYLVK